MQPISAPKYSPISINNKMKISNQKPINQKQNSKIRASNSFKVTTPKRTVDIGVKIIKKKRISLEEEKKKKKKPKNQTIAQPVKDFVISKNNVELEGGFQLPKSIYEKLFEHQQTSVKWLWELYRSEVGGIIADEMGLGKTIQVVCFIAGLQYSGMIQLPCLICCPTTIMTQWQLEFQRWWPHIRVEILHTTECNDFDRLLTTIQRDKGVIITSFGTLQSFQESILPIDFEVVVLDEGHKIRNPDARITITAKQLRTPNRIILTGAPIQNNLQELWSLFDFIFPGKLGTLPVFKDTFGKFF